MKIKRISKEHIGQTLTLSGWVRSVRDQKSFAFIELNDGTSFSSLQIIVGEQFRNEIDQITTGASLTVKGTLVESPGKQPFELQTEDLKIHGTCPAADYPLQKKRHSFEFLRTIAHLRPRTNTQGAIARIRNALAYATHQFFQERDFLYIHTPIITASDAEGAGELFQVTTLDQSCPPKLSDGTVDHTKDFFSTKTHLTVSGQLNAEAMACALTDVYTFGPTFRAENSNTSRHLAEFWMIEPEMAFCDLDRLIEVGERYIKAVVGTLLDDHQQDMAFFDQFIEKNLIKRLENILDHEFARLSYTEAIAILEQSNQTFAFPVKWGIDLQSEHERYLAEEHLKKPVFIYNYPEKIKAFYMRQNEDEKTVAAFDLLVPKIGEIIGGSQREERQSILERKILDSGLQLEDYWWYSQLRRYGTVPHGGFGVGFERLIQFATGIENIRDTIPFPRYPGHADF